MTATELEDEKDSMRARVVLSKGPESHWKITNSHKQNGLKLKLLTLVLIQYLHSMIVPQHL
jgi:hypothetical protein